jgi:Transcriptional regulator PadR-like family
VVARRSTIYPTLTLLEEFGYVTVSTGDSAKKLHEITAEGRAFLDANRRAVDALLARMVETSRAHAARLLTASACVTVAHAGSPADTLQGLRAIVPGALGPLWHSGLTAATPACHARERR